MKRSLKVLGLLLGSAVLAGCAGLRNVSNDVSSFGDWPAGRAPGSFAFDRLPSQQALAGETGRLEAAARPALERAGFAPAAEGQPADVLVQVGARSTRSERVVWGEPIWWQGGFGHSRFSPWLGSGWVWYPAHDFPRYQREVAVLIRDRASGKPIFEARATNEGTASTDEVLLAAMFEASLMDFPRLGVNPRRVVVPVAP
jgi:predicted small secreted protein